MRLEEAYLQIVQQELEENKLTQAVAGAVVAGSLLAGIHQVLKPLAKQEPTAQRAITGEVAKEDDSAHRDHLLKTVTSKFKVEPEKAKKIVDLAIKHSDPVFPKAHHILALAGVESSFNEKAKSQLKRDPAVGLMQIRPGVWGIHPNELSTMEGQIKHGSDILKHYHKKLGTPEATFAAYNIGITNHRKGRQTEAADRYVGKITSELKRYESTD